MNKVKNEIQKYKSERKLIKSTPKYAPAGQSTQMIVGATNETDAEVMYTATYLYKKYNMKRVYYSGYIPISYDSRLPAIGTEVPMLRENRLYQTDWLLRFYGFSIEELLNKNHPNLDSDIDPKLSWALRNLHHFPIDINKSDKQLLARVPGLGMKSVYKILHGRKYRKLNWEHLQKMGVALNRAKYFITCDSRNFETKDYTPAQIKYKILSTSQTKYKNTLSQQLNLFG